jgi:hypothetical protein
MTSPFTYTRTITWIKRVRANTFTRQGNDTFTEVATSMVDCIFWPRDNTETSSSQTTQVISDRGTATTAISVLIPTQYGVTSGDALDLAGIDVAVDGIYEVEGQPQVIENPYTGDVYKIVNAIRKTG